MYSSNKAINKVAAIVLLEIIILAGIVYYFVIYQPSIVGPKPHVVISPTPAVTAAPTATTPETLTNLNWGGYIAASNLTAPEPTVTSVSGSWTVPTVSVSTGNTFSSVWVGIGGFFDTSLIQCGTEQDSFSGQTAYSAWYELLPAVSVTINTITVSPGDSMNASVNLVDAGTDLWQISISDLTTSQQFRSTFTYNSSESSADWIIERPNVNGRLGDLADFGTLTISNCQATIGGVTGSIGEFPSLKVVMSQSANKNTQLLDVSSLQDDGLSFTETYIGS